MILISADPSEAQTRFREKTGATFAILSDEKHEAADHYGIPICYRSPRWQVYPHGFNQPAVIGYVGEREAYRWIQKPTWWNFYGGWRPSPKRVLAAMRRAFRRNA